MPTGGGRWTAVPRRPNTPALWKVRAICPLRDYQIVRIQDSIQPNWTSFLKSFGGTLRKRLRGAAIFECRLSNFLLDTEL